MLVPTITITLIAVLLFTYLMAVRPWHLQWGASHLDRVALLPGDEISPRAPTHITRAININASPEAIWPALERIVRQRAKIADMVIAIEQPLHAFVLVTASELPRVQAGDETLDATWAFFLKPLPGGGRTRLIARMREAAFPGLWTHAVNLFYREPTHFLMERKMLLVIKQEAEKAA